LRFGEGEEELDEIDKERVVAAAADEGDVVEREREDEGRGERDVERHEVGK